LVEPWDKNHVSLVCFLFDCLCSQELVSSYLVVLTLINKFVAISVEFTRITYSPPLGALNTIFGKSSIKQSHIDSMRGRYFRDMSIVRVGGDSTAPTPEENEVVIYRSFLKAGLRFPLSKFVVEVLKIFQIFFHQITLEAIIRMGMFVWAVRSQGLEPSAKCFCNMHELLYETKATDKEQYHNNFGCYEFIARSNASYPVPTYRKRWPGA
jgi:hypothetical protein